MAFSDEGIEISVPAPQRVTIPTEWPDEAPVEEPAKVPEEGPVNV